MKKVLLILAMLISVVSAWAQTDKLQTISKELNKECPREIAENMTLQKVEMGDNSIIFVYDIPDALYANMESLGGILHDSLLAEMESTPDETIQRLITVCKDSKSNIIHRYTDSAGDAFNIIITYDEF